ncbi:DUF4251 domain-containing protein [uncultured Aquimarina sp.]|uniref:DUF4251 domain-containing protein n=1 Tax=uncultured Aquimarina sp. TaxID=575652 RepID=UPI0026168B62|nr:DUF4251 domain-containing protein [uncultured Aquimarina sp.]
MRSLVFMLMIGGMLIGCNSAKKTIVPTAKSEALQVLISKKSFSIESDWAYPLRTASMNSIANSGLLPPGSSSGGITLIGNSNHIKIYGDSIAMNLPYFGEQQLPRRFTRNGGGIVFKGIPDHYEVIKDEKRQQHVIKFSANNNMESYRVIITLFPNWSSNITVNSTHRTFIRYAGTVSALDAESKIVTN